MEEEEREENEEEEEHEEEEKQEEGREEMSCRSGHCFFSKTPLPCLAGGSATGETFRHVDDVAFGVHHAILQISTISHILGGERSVPVLEVIEQADDQGLILTKCRKL